MKVFISWSGERSNHVASALHRWLPAVIQAIEPWLSSHDLGAGRRWSPEIARQLSECKGGILCCDHTNVESVWMAFEAGALAGTLGQELVIPYLLDMRPTELAHPLADFNAVEATREGTLKMLQSLASAVIPKLPSDRLLLLFDRMWEDLAQDLHKAIKIDSPPQHTTSNSDPFHSSDRVDEVLGATRAIQKQLDIVVSDLAQMKWVSRPNPYLERELQRAIQSNSPGSDYNGPNGPLSSLRGGSYLTGPAGYEGGPSRYNSTPDAPEYEASGPASSD